MKFFYFALLFAVLFATSKADESQYIKYVRNLNTAHLIEPGQMEFTFKFGLMNDAIDMFDFKSKIVESENIDINQFSKFGDWQSYHTFFNMGLAKRLNARFEFGYDLIEIGKSEAEVKNFALELKVMLLEEKLSFPTISLSVGYNTHIANNIKGDIRALSFNLGEISINQTFDPPEELTVGGLNDQSVYIGLHMGKVINERFMFYTFNRLTYTQVSSEFSTSLQIGQFQKLENDFKYDSLNYKLGIGAFFQLKQSLLLTGEYQFNYFKRDFVDNAPFAGKNEKIAHTLDLSIHYLMTDHLAMSFGAWFSSSFLASEFPLTYNRKSASKFDNPYGQLYLTFTVGFSLFQ